VGHSRVGKWSTGGTKPRDLAVRSPEILMLGFVSREVSIEVMGVDKSTLVRIGISAHRVSEVGEPKVWYRQ
jgi:hypothetical protein